MTSTLFRGLAATVIGLSTAGIVGADVMVTSAQLSHTTGGVFGNRTFPTSPELSDLTALGTTDWAVWGWDSNAIVELRQKNGGSGIGALTSNKTSGQRSPATVSNGQLNSAFDFTDGTPPNETGNNFSGGAGLDRQGSPNPLPIFSFDAPMNADGSDNVLIVWFSGQKINTNGVNIKLFDGATQIGSTIIPTIATGDNKNMWIYEFEYGGADSARDLTFTFTMTSGGQDDAMIMMHGAALQVIPEPASLALLGLGGLLLLPRRRHESVI